MGYISLLEDIIDRQLEGGAAYTVSEWIASAPSRQSRMDRAIANLRRSETKLRDALCSLVECRHANGEDSIEVKGAKAGYAKACVALSNAGLEMYKAALEYPQRSRPVKWCKSWSSC